MRSVCDIDFGTIWVCLCCTLIHANGECCDSTDGRQPWAGVDFTRFTVTMGLAREEHHEECVPGEDCDCERVEFSGSTCEGCGSELAGYRHAFTLWRTRQRFVRPSLPGLIGERR